MISLTDKVRLKESVLREDLAEEAILLDLESEEYFSLDEVGARMLEVLTESESIGAACATLLSEYEVEPEILEEDLLAYITALNNNELVEVIDK